MYISEREGANNWLSVLIDLKALGVKDIFITCIDNLTGFSEAINSVFPEAKVQSCTVHQVRNSLKYVAYKDQKVFIGYIAHRFFVNFGGYFIQYMIGQLFSSVVPDWLCRTFVV